MRVLLCLVYVDLYLMLLGSLLVRLGMFVFSSSIWLAVSSSS